MPIRWTGSLKGKENHIKMLDVFIDNYKSHFISLAKCNS